MRPAMGEVRPTLQALSSTLTVTALSGTATATTLTTSTASPLAGASVVLTATVASSAATGTVTFKDGSTTLGTGTLSSGVTTYTVSSITSGTHSYTAAYAGATGYAASTSPFPDSHCYSRSDHQPVRATTTPTASRLRGPLLKVAAWTYIPEWPTTRQLWAPLPASAASPSPSVQRMLWTRFMQQGWRCQQGPTATSTFLERELMARKRVKSSRSGTPMELSVTFVQNTSDWKTPLGYNNEISVLTAANYLNSSGTVVTTPVHIYGYTFPLINGKTAFLDHPSA